jgi:hypothetical protein
MPYSDLDREFISSVAGASSSLHLQELRRLIKENSPYSEIFEYGAAYLPRIRDEITGIVDLERMDDYRPQIMEYFDALSDLPSLPPRLQELATDFAIYANGETLQHDAFYLNFDYRAEIRKALRETVGSD